MSSFNTVLLTCRWEEALKIWNEVKEQTENLLGCLVLFGEQKMGERRKWMFNLLKEIWRASVSDSALIFLQYSKLMLHQITDLVFFQFASVAYKSPYCFYKVGLCEGQWWTNETIQTFQHSSHFKKGSSISWRRAECREVWRVKGRNQFSCSAIRCVLRWL